MMKRITFTLLLLTFGFTAYSETIKLKNGRVIKADIIKRTDNSIKVDINGTSITYYFDEIESIDARRVDFFSSEK